MALFRSAIQREGVLADMMLAGKQSIKAAIAAIALLLACGFVLSGCSASQEEAGGVTLASFEGKSVAVVTGSAQQEMIPSLWDDIEVLSYNAFPDIFAAVSTGKADCGVCAAGTFIEGQKSNPTLTPVNDEVASSAGAFAFPKGSTDTKLYQEMNEYLAKIKADGTLDKIVEIWSGDDEDAKVIPDISELSGENGSLRVVIPVNEPPYEYYKGDAVVGVDPTILFNFCKEYGYTYTIDDVPLASVLVALNSGKYDLSTSMYIITEERQKNVDFTDPILSFGNVVFYNDTSGEGSGWGIAESFEKTFVAENRWKIILGGLGVTLLVTILAAVLGTALGFGLALARRNGGKVVNKIIDIYVRIFQGTPVLVMLLIFYYVIFGSANISSVIVASIVFGLNSAAFIEEALYTNITAVGPGQREAALASGFTEWQAFRYFILPIAIRRTLPVYRGEIITLLKGTSVVGYIALVDLTKAGDIIRSRTYEALFPLLSIAIIYLVMGWLISILLKKVEQRLTISSRSVKIKGVELR